MRLHNKIALVIGGGSGIGRAIAIRFAQEGAHVTVADVNIKAGQETLSSIQSFDSDGRFLAVDVTDREQLRQLLEQVETLDGGLNILVNSAGISGRGRIEEVADDLWDRVVAVNLSGVFWACKYAVPILRRAGGGAILNLASIAGLREAPGSAIYSATKGGVVMLSRTMAADYARENIRVRAICPTAVDTPLIERIFAGADDPNTARAEYAKQQPMGRMITTEEIAALAVFFASDEAIPYFPEPVVV